MFMLSVLLIGLVSAGKKCPARCICNTGKDGTRGWKDKMYGAQGAGTDCTACLPAYEGDWWGDRCEEPCGEFRTLDMAGRDDAEEYALGNCDGCTFKGQCKACIEGHWGNKCRKECPQNCRDSKTGAWECNNWGGCFGCKTGFCGFVENEEGGCATPCSPTCRDAGKCHPGSCKCDGCAEGFWGSKCEKKCKEGCKFCKQASGACTECLDTHWAKGGNARICAKCPDNCKEGTCDTEGKCDKGCINGFFGEKCEKECPANCDGGKCKQNGECECSPGFFGKDCKGNCPDGCATDECSEIGECDCKDGFFGLVCESGFCEGECDKKCPEHCADQCDRKDGTCTCSHGWWGTKCEHKCPDHCKGGSCGKDGSCDAGCDLGFWQHDCEVDCDTGCQGSACRQYDGWCECEAGKWGASEIFDDKRKESCSKGCPHCLNPALKSDVVCNAITGRCSDCPGLSAPKAKYGPMCELDCPANCEDHCNRGSGFCKCRSGFWGEDCEACPEKCTNMCDDEGKCVDGCELGLWGPTCTEHCSEHCHGQLCSQDNGDCVRGCVTGWWGSNCKNDCPKNTAAHLGCHIETGHSTECKTGFWGDKCEKDCPENCEEGCSKDKGTCSSCQDSEWHGTKCETRCSKDCDGGQCDMAGQCHSCAQDAAGNHLRWGKTCENQCAKNCASGCDVENGRCNHCAPGTWHGASGFCDGVCHVSCGACDGPSANDCTRCDFAAQLQKSGKAHTCDCIQPFAKRWETADQIVPRGPAGHTLRKAGKCTCEWDEKNGIAQKYLFGAGGGSMRYCSPGSPRGTVEASGTVYPTGILWPPKEGWQQGRCGAEELEVVPAKPFCVHMVAAVEMYKSERIGASVKPPASAWDASRVCSTWADVSDAECQKGDAGFNTRTKDGDVKCGLLVDSFCMPMADWTHTTAGHRVRGNEESLLESHVVRRAL